MARTTTTSRPLIRPCSCGRPAMGYVTAEGPRYAPYCRECAGGRRGVPATTH